MTSEQKQRLEEIYHLRRVREDLKLINADLLAACEAINAIAGSGLIFESDAAAGVAMDKVRAAIARAKRGRS
jgi:hypothetical protein